MNTTQFLNLLMVIFAILISRPIYAVSCGDVITSNTALSAELHCSTGYYAIEISVGHTAILNDFVTSNQNLNKVEIEF
jgi:hypothetical protein